MNAGSSGSTPVAAVDIGTQSVRLLVSDGTRDLERRAVVTHLGRAMRDGRFESVGLEATLDALRSFRVLLDRHGVGRVRAVATEAVPLVVDGDALSALGERAADILRARSAAAVLTPHDGEYERLTGRRPGPDRFDAARSLAAASRSVVLLKGPTTVVADPEGRVGVCTTGDARLATAGTGDVLTGIVGALLARGVDRKSTRLNSSH